MNSSKYRENHSKIKDSLIIGLLKALIVKTTGQRENPVYQNKVLAFARISKNYSTKAYDFLASYIKMPSVRYLSRINAKNSVENIYEVSEEALFTRLNNIIVSLYEKCKQKVSCMLDFDTFRFRPVSLSTLYISQRERSTQK